jgi:hypothetical protein
MAWEHGMRHECDERNMPPMMDDPRNRFTLQAEKDFRPSVRPVYRNSDQDKRVEHVGSCLLLDIEGSACIVTAAHIMDQGALGPLYIAGRPGTQLVPILDGTVVTTLMPAAGRNYDPIDVGFWLPPAAALDSLGTVDFLHASRVPQGVQPSKARLYTAFGYPLSRNKNRIDHRERSISTGISMYTAGVEVMPKLAAKLGVSGAGHLFLRFNKHSFDADGAHANTFGPRGLSGGALLDLGEFESTESYEREPKGSALLSGMVIEYHPEHDALVAVRIEVVIGTIQRALTRHYASLGSDQCGNSPGPASP